MKRTKILWILLLTGLLGTVAATGLLLGTGSVRPCTDTLSYPVEEAGSIERVRLELHLAQVGAVPDDGDPRVEVYVNAWLPRPLSEYAVASIGVQDGTLSVTEFPFPDEFLGLFPQPYEMKITLYLPAAALAEIEEVRK